jgi:hypothetical protein
MPWWAWLLMIGGDVLGVVIIVAYIESDYRDRVAR